MKIDLQSLEARHPAAPSGAAPALRISNLQLQAGEQVAVIGPSGAGKTTLLQVMACAQRPTQGILQLAGQDPWGLSAQRLKQLRSQLFLAPQLPPLPPRQRVINAILAGRLPAMGLWTSLRSLFYPVNIPATHEALAHFDLADKLFERVDRLSGGERQRVGLARALLAPANLWLIDEPLSALDPTRARMAIVSLVSLARQRRTTLVASLHQVDIALAHFERIVGLRDGQIVFDLPATQVTPELLARLYKQHEYELRGEILTVPAEFAAFSDAAPVMMQCR